jgi:hypothetical protein
VLGVYYPLTKFLITLIVFDHFWDFDKLVEDGAPRRSRYPGISPPFAGFLGFRVYVMDMGCQTIGSPMFMPIL